MEFVKSERELSKPQKDGATLRQHYEMAQKAGRNCPELIVAEVPKQIKYMLYRFNDLKISPNHVLTWQEIKSWSEVTGHKINDWELSTILAIDRVI